MTTRDPTDTFLPERFDYLSLYGVKKVTGMSKSSVYRLVKDGDFPKPVKLIGNRVGWPDYEVYQWNRERLSASRHPDNQPTTA